MADTYTDSDPPTLENARDDRSGLSPISTTNRRPVQQRNQEYPTPTLQVLSAHSAQTQPAGSWPIQGLSLIHISEPTRRTPISYAVFCLKKKKKEKARIVG